MPPTLMAHAGVAQGREMKKRVAVGRRERGCVVEEEVEEECFGRSRLLFSLGLLSVSRCAQRVCAHRHTCIRAYARARARTHTHTHTHTRAGLVVSFVAIPGLGVWGVEKWQGVGVMG